MLFKNKTDYLMESIRLGRSMTSGEKLNLIAGLSVPSMLAQISTVLMFFIDASMVGHLGAEASASIGIIESTTWLVGSLLSAAATGFSVQVAHFIGANDLVKARQVFRHALICGVAFSLFVTLIGVGIHSHLPYWLGGGEDIAPNSSRYFLIYSLVLPFVFLYHISEMMLKSAGNMHTPSIMAVLICLCDVAFNYLFIYMMKMGGSGRCDGYGNGVYLHFAAQSLSFGIQKPIAQSPSGQGAVQMGKGICKACLQNKHPDSYTKYPDERCADSEHHDCGSIGQYCYCFPFVCHHCRESLLYAGLRYW